MYLNYIKTLIFWVFFHIFIDISQNQKKRRIYQQGILNAGSPLRIKKIFKKKKHQIFFFPSNKREYEIITTGVGVWWKRRVTRKEWRPICHAFDDKSLQLGKQQHHLSYHSLTSQIGPYREKLTQVKKAVTMCSSLIFFQQWKRNRGGTKDISTRNSKMHFSL